MSDIIHLAQTNKNGVLVPACWRARNKGKYRGDWRGSTELAHVDCPRCLESVEVHVGSLTFTVTTNPGMPPESFAIVTDTQVSIWNRGAITTLSREEYDRTVNYQDTTKGAA